MPKRVVIVGGGFGGLYCAKALAKADVAVTVVDKENHHLFQPLLYQVATAGLSPADIAWPIRSVLRKQANATVLMAEVAGIDQERRVVVHSEGETPYDVLVLATGATHSYFGHADWETLAGGLKNLNDATAVRSKMLTAFEEAEACTDEEERRAWLTIAIVGAGPTGVEMAGSIAELANRAMSRDFRHIDPRKAEVVLIEGADRILTTYSERLSRDALASLTRLGVKVRLRETVSGISREGVTTTAGFLPARTVVWAAGVKASPVAQWLGAESDRAGRVLTDDHCRVSENIYVIGDCAHFPAEPGHELPGVAQTAMQQGTYVARLIQEFPSGAFVYKNLGSLATIGRKAAVAQFAHFQFSGFFAWLMWMGIHLWSLLGVRRKGLVFIQWAWAYVTYRRGARLITRHVR